MATTLATSPSQTAALSLLQDLLELLESRLLFGFDEAALGRLATCCVFLRDTATAPALWRRLALRADRLAAVRCLGVLSREVAEAWADAEESPALLTVRAGRGAIDWRDVCRQLNPRTAVKPWARQGGDGVDAAGADITMETSAGAVASFPAGTAASVAAGATGAWRELVRAPAPNGAEAVEPFAGQSPHLFWVGGNRLLALAGVYFGDMLGGVMDMPLGDGYMIELQDEDAEMGDADAAPPLDAGGGMVAARPSAAYSIRTLQFHSGDVGGAMPRHPSMNGAASDFDPARRMVLFFGGGSPHREVFNTTTALRLIGWEDVESERSPSTGSTSAARAPLARWEVVRTPGSIEAGTLPPGRQGMRGVVCGDEFLFFGGRELGGACRDDVWALDLSMTGVGSSSCRWRQLVCEGQSPSPRVWYSACHAVYGRWFIFGGSTWQFEEPDQPHDYRTLYVFDIVARQWSSIEPRGGVPPPWTVAATFVPLGYSQLLLLGGTMPHLIGPNGLTEQNLARWRRWYGRLDQPYIFDLFEEAWTQERSSTPTSGVGLEAHIHEVYLRSHLAAVFVPARRSVVVFGGARYFTGEYFHDVLELRLPGPLSSVGSSGATLQSTSIFGAGCSEAEVGSGGVLGDFRGEDTLPPFLGHRQGRARRLTPGFVGRLRPMARDGLLVPGDMQRIMEHF